MCKSTQIDASFQTCTDLRFVWPPTCTDLHRLEVTCMEFEHVQIFMQVDAGFSPKNSEERVSKGKSTLKKSKVKASSLVSSSRETFDSVSDSETVKKWKSFLQNLHELASTCVSFGHLLQVDANFFCHAELALTCISFWPGLNILYCKHRSTT